MIDFVPLALVTVGFLSFVGLLLGLGFNKKRVFDIVFNISASVLVGCGLAGVVAFGIALGKAWLRIAGWL